MKSKLLFPLIAFFFTLFTTAQNLVIQNGNWTECDFILTDTGDVTSNYGNDENLTLTLCPAVDGGFMTINFSEFSTQVDVDSLSIYDGISVDSPLIGTYSGTNNPGFISADNASGCLTLNFISDGSVTSTGWAAEVFCEAQDFQINQPSDYFVCGDNGDVIGTFDFTSKNAEILGGLSPTNYAVSYYATQQEANSMVNPLVSPYFNVSNPQQIFVSVMDINTGNIQQTSFLIFVNVTPQPDLLDVYEFCEGGSIVINSFLSDPNLSFQWYMDGFVLPNQIFSQIEVTEPGSYQLEVLTPEGCFSFTSTEVILGSFQINSPTPLVVCDDNDDGFAEFDLESKTLEILGGNNNPTLFVTYHETEADAFNNVNPLASPYTNVTQLNQVIYARASSISGDCSSVVPIELVVDINCISTSSVTVNLCAVDDNMTIDLDLTTNEPELINGQTISDFTFGYYFSLPDADNQDNAITNPDNFSITGSSITIYVRIEEVATGDYAIESLNVNYNVNPQVSFNDFYAICSGQEIVLTPFVDGASIQNFTFLWSNGQTGQEIVVSEPGVYSVTVTDATGCSSFAEVFVDEGELPATSQPNNITSCDSNSVFDLTSVFPQLLNGEDPTNFNISFHVNISDAFTQSNAITIPEAYTASSSPQTIYVVVQNISNSCLSVESFNIISENCPIDVICGDDPVNTTYCYELNSADEYTYTSTDGSPVQVTFNSGQVETDWDELTVLDSDGTLLYSGYGNNGDLSGLTFMSSGDTLTLYVDSDDIFACADQNYPPIDYDVNCIDSDAVPNCVSFLSAPVNGDADVNENTDLTWTAATGLVVGYKLSVGITSGGTEVLDNEDVGNVLTYDIGMLDYEITYYVTITAYNDNGDAIECTEESFTTRANPNQTVVCNDGAINTMYCYDDFDTTQFSFQSDTGEPLTIFFNAGLTEFTYDAVRILDTDGTVLNPNQLYGNDGDFSGLSFTSTGASLTLAFDSDNIFSCASPGGNDCCSAPFDFDVFCSSTVGIIEVNAFIDANANTVFDTTEPSFSNGYFTYEKNNDGTINTVNSSSGSFQIVSTNEVDVYDFTFNFYEESLGCYDLTTTTFENISVATGATETIDFAVVEEQSCEDLAVFVINYGIPPRPGFQHENYLVLENLGFTTITSGTVEFIADPQLVFNSVFSFDPNYTINTTASGFTVDFVNLDPGAIEFIGVSLTCPATVELGEIVTNTANYSTATNDLVSSNNYSTLSELVVGSWDPNDKRESHGPRVNYEDFVASDQWLYYTIRFQNLGTFPAEFVRIDDALDSQLDETTFQMLRSSHDYVVTRTDTDLEWFFEDINLAAAQDDEDGSQGYVYFRIKPKPGYALGDIIPNTAAIFFDFNAPIITNRFDTEFVQENLSVGDADFIRFDMFPNPAKDKVTIRLNANNFGNVTINIIDVQGKLILEQHISEGNNIELNIADLQSGLYLVKLQADANSLVKKLIIE